MLGYIQKDQGQAHYELWHSNIPEDVLWDAHEAYQIARADFTADRKLITKTNAFDVIYQFWTQCCCC
ncbi:TPA: hypothetical protein ACH3X2_000157 [Trebouxia sp. C0005]